MTDRWEPEELEGRDYPEIYWLVSVAQEVLDEDGRLRSRLTHWVPYVVGEDDKLTFWSLSRRRSRDLPQSA
jgi:hypothetical protein